MANVSKDNFADSRKLDKLNLIFFTVFFYLKLWLKWFQCILTIVPSFDCLTLLWPVMTFGQVVYHEQHIKTFWQRHRVLFPEAVLVGPEENLPENEARNMAVWVEPHQALPTLDRASFSPTALNLPCVAMCLSSEACKKDPNCDYYFSIDSDVALINPDTLRILIEENKYVTSRNTHTCTNAHTHWASTDSRNDSLADAIHRFTVFPWCPGLKTRDNSFVPMTVVFQSKCDLSKILTVQLWFAIVFSSSGNSHNSCPHSLLSIMIVIFSLCLFEKI